MNTLLYMTIIFIFILIESPLSQNKEIITIYKSPIFKLIFLFGIYLYGNDNIIFTLIYAMYYIYLGQKIQKIELTLTVNSN